MPAGSLGCSGESMHSVLQAEWCGVPLVFAVMLSAESTPQVWGSRSAPRTHRCCPNPQPEVSGACAAQLGWCCGLGGSALVTALGMQAALQRQRQGLHGEGWGGAPKTGGAGRMPKAKLWIMSPQESPAWVLVGAAAGAPAGAELPVPPRTELSKVLAPGCCAAGAQKRSVRWLQGSQEVSKWKWGCRDQCRQLGAQRWGAASEGCGGRGLGGDRRIYRHRVGDSTLEALGAAGKEEPHLHLRQLRLTPWVAAGLPPHSAVGAPMWAST